MLSPQFLVSLPLMSTIRRDAASLLPEDYPALLAELKSRVNAARIRAVRSMNQELIALYWQIGDLIARRQTQEGWGTAVVPRLASDLRKEFPTIKGFSERNLGYMIRFAKEYGSPSILQQAAAKLTPSSEPKAILQQAAAKLPWFHHVLLLEKVKDSSTRAWYVQHAIEHGWSRAVLGVQIETKAHRRLGKASTNFKNTLPQAESDLAQQTIKDPYIFDFLSLSSDVRERDLEEGLVKHIQKFLLELGVGFAFVGRQVHLEVDDQDYYIDLLFYHLKLRCYVVVDLKTQRFEPEFAGKMNFYLSAVDDLMRHPDDKPSIGLLLCKDKRDFTVEYALRNLSKPIGVAQWKTVLVESLPKKLQGSLPSIEELEKELTGE